MSHRSADKSRFSLIELMIVLIIMGLLAALVTPAVMKRLNEGRVRTAKAQVGLLHTALKGYQMDVGGLPPSLDALVRNPGDDSWDGPYVDPPKVPKDPWDNQYHFQVPGPDGLGCLVVCYGADGSPGGEKYDADITVMTD